MIKFKFGRGIVNDENVFLRLTTVEVRVGERRIRATWTPQMVQDIQAFQGIDAEAELTALLSEQMATAIDRDILRNVRLSYRYVTENIFYFKPFKFGR